VSLFYQHNFKGFFLGKIPLLKNLKWREAISIKGVYGTLSKKNNLEKPILLFPEGMSDLKKPYVEMGVGITNIFRIFRVDTYWRLT
ncbi:MAG: carboxypeptidase-like regulatory domain-containing protein, partial [Bacteroidales bacterium]